MSHPSLSPGQVFAGGYRVERPLSEGGMGSVYVVTQLTTQRKRALKVMLPALAQHPKFQQRFRQEAQVGAQIRSEHVVEVVDAGFDEASNTPYLAMELLEGADLADTMESRGPLGRDEVATIFEQTCHALSAAHKAGIVHRDLKPENLFLAQSRRADIDWTLKILDFGIAKMVAEAQTASKHTQSIGSPLWMAPEQTKTGGIITPQTDIWALGLIAFYLLTGRSYWRAANEPTVEQMKLLREIAIDDLPSASERAQSLVVGHLLPAGFDAWFARCAARSPTDRFEDVAQAASGIISLLRTGVAQRLSAPGSGPSLETLPNSAEIATSAFAPDLVDGGAAVTNQDGPDKTVPDEAVADKTVPDRNPQPTRDAPPSPATAPRPPAVQPVTAPQTPGARPVATAPGSTATPQQPGGAPGAQLQAAAVASGSESGSRVLPVLAGIVALLLVGGGVWFGLGDDTDTTLPEPITDTPTTPTSPTASADAPSPEPPALEPDPAPDSTPEPSASADAATVPPPAIGPKPSWPPSKPIRPVSKPTPDPPPKPPPVRPPPPPVRPPPPRPPPSPYGRPCRTAADCGAGWDCSYGKKCVRM